MHQSSVPFISISQARQRVLDILEDTAEPGGSGQGSRRESLSWPLSTYDEMPFHALPSKRVQTRRIGVTQVASCTLSTRGERRRVLSDKGVYDCRVKSLLFRPP